MREQTPIGDHVMSDRQPTPGVHEHMPRPFDRAAKACYEGRFQGELALVADWDKLPEYVKDRWRDAVSAVLLTGQPAPDHPRAPVTDEELKQWAELRADDAGRLARELISYRRAVTTSSGAPLSEFELLVVKDLISLGWETMFAIDFGDHGEHAYEIDRSRADEIEKILARLSDLPDAKGTKLTMEKVEAALCRLIDTAPPSPQSHLRWPTWWRMSPQMEEAFEAYERVKADLDDFDGDRRGHLHALARREHDLLKSISYSQDPEDDSRDSWLIDGIFKSVIDNLRAFRAATTEGSDNG